MKFRNDDHRKAVFANMFGKGESRRTKVQSFGSVTNFEVKGSGKTYKSSLSNKTIMKGQRNVTLKDLKSKPSKEFCNMCKGKDLKLKRGRCKQCKSEDKNFEKTRKEIERQADIKKKLVLKNKRDVFSIINSAGIEEFDDEEYEEAPLDTYHFRMDANYQFLVHQPVGGIATAQLIKIAEKPNEVTIFFNWGTLAKSAAKALKAYGYKADEPRNYGGFALKIDLGLERSGEKGRKEKESSIKNLKETKRQVGNYKWRPKE